MIKRLTIVFLAIFIGLMYGCSSTNPTQTSTTTDDRPTLMFNFEGIIPVGPVNIYIDDIYMGDALKFKQGELGLKIIAGSHFIRIEHQNTIVLEEKVYVGRGSTKVININVH
jgi:hypothetical protein